MGEKEHKKKVEGGGGWGVSFFLNSLEVRTLSCSARSITVLRKGVNDESPGS